MPVATLEKTPILEQIYKRYQVGDNFGLEYLKHWFKPEELVNLNLDDLNLSTLYQSRFDFALSTNIRGEEFYREITPYLPKFGNRYLDVGCGYGGFMVAFHNHGYRVAGIDINPGLIYFTNNNLKDYKIEALVLQDSILTDGIKEKLGMFDVISCYDVIEHVENVPTCLEKVTDLLNPDGILGLKIPNKDSIKFVTKDGHYNLFGITLLKHELAYQYHRKFFTTEYDVGEYYPLPYYINQLERLGCSVHVLGRDRYLRFRRGPDLIKDLLSQYLVFRKKARFSIPNEISSQININFMRYFFRVLMTFLFPIDVPSFRERYLTDFWTILAVKGNMVKTNL